MECDDDDGGGGNARSPAFLFSLVSLSRMDVRRHNSIATSTTQGKAVDPHLPPGTVASCKLGWILFLLLTFVCVCMIPGPRTYQSHCHQMQHHEREMTASEEEESKP